MNQQSKYLPSIHRLIPVMILAGFLSGCLQSLHPLYTEDDLIQDSRLEGTWVMNGETWIFTPYEKAYLLTQISDQDTSVFVASLLKLDEYYFLDTYPYEVEVLGTDWMMVHLMGVHVFSKVTLDDQSFELSMLKASYVKSLIEENKTDIKHEIIDDEVVLTAPTADLQEFVRMHANITSAFDDPNRFVRP